MSTWAKDSGYFCQGARDSVEKTDKHRGHDYSDIQPCCAERYDEEL